MTSHANSWPTANKRHRCGVCRWWIEPGETYWRQAGLDRCQAWTNRTCGWCERVAWAYLRVTGECEWDAEDCLEWLRDEHPAVWESMLAGWRWPDGERVPLPFGSTCVTCGTRIEFRHLWCPPCDEKRIDRLNRQFAEIAREFDVARWSGTS